MITTETIVQLKAFTRQDGLILALLWIASFACMVYAPESGLGTLLALSTPCIVVWRMIAFRNYALGGVLSFRRGVAYVWYCFFYASILFAVAQYLYFRFLDHGFMAQLLTQTGQMLMPYYEKQGISAQYVSNAITMFNSMTPIQLAFVFMMENILTGILLSAPLALIGMSKRPVKKK